MLAQVHTLTTHDAVKIIIWSFVLIGVLVVAFALVARMKRRFRDDIDRNPGASAGFTLADLRQMRRDGVITDEEFEKARAMIVQSASPKAAVRPAVAGAAGISPADEESLEFLDEPPAEDHDAPPA